MAGRSVTQIISSSKEESVNEQKRRTAVTEEHLDRQRERVHNDPLTDDALSDLGDAYQDYIAALSGQAGRR